MDDPETKAGRALLAQYREWEADNLADTDEKDVADLRDAILAIEAEAAIVPEAARHPVLVKYGLEGMAGDPLDNLDRHLTNNHAAALGAARAIVPEATAQLGKEPGRFVDDSTEIDALRYRVRKLEEALAAEREASRQMQRAELTDYQRGYVHGQEAALAAESEAK